MLSEIDMLLRLLLAAVLGAAIGWQRERHAQPAGLRTHTILVVGSALAMMLSINLALQFPPLVNDPARLAAQVISGIGFLGAGAILREGFTVKGLTTATSMWTMAIVGLAVGDGYFITSVAVTVLLLVVLSILYWFERRYIHAAVTVFITLKAEDRVGLIDEVKRVLTQKSRRIDAMSVRRNLEDRIISIEVTMESHESDTSSRLMDELSDIQGVRSFKVG
jgi:putative Mg2+ transporter-C (MgtC) family protein